MTEPKTYLEICNIIAEHWNKTKACKRPITGMDVWGLTAKGKEFSGFPALYLGELYYACERDDLIGLLLTDQFFAKVFLENFVEASPNE